MCDALMQTAGFIGSKSLIIGQSCPFYEVKKKHSNSLGTAEKKTDDWLTSIFHFRLFSGHAWSRKMGTFRDFRPWKMDCTKNKIKSKKFLAYFEVKDDITPHNFMII